MSLTATLPAARIRRWLGAGLALLALWAALILPNHPGAMTWGALALQPLDLAAVVLLLLLVPRAATPVATAVWVLTLVKLVDVAGHLALGRALNPGTDLVLLPLGWALARDVLGLPAALAAAAALVVLAVLLWRGLRAACRRIAAFAPARARPALALGLVAALGLAVAETAKAIDPPGEAFTTRLAWEHARDAVTARRALKAFRAEAAAEPVRAPQDILPALAGRDLLIVFVESYGRSALEAAPYAALPALLARLELPPAMAARSGWLVSPISGGQSWLARSSALSGLTIDDEARFRALLASPRRTLLHLAQTAGWRSVALVPAISRAWPEAAWHGYDRVLASGDLGYKGPPFGWAPVPDQFALAAFERMELAPSLHATVPRAPVVAEIALTSSHAPWTPVPALRDWEDLGDGSAYRAEGPAPERLWRDPDRVRAKYALTLAYSLETAVAFAARHPQALTLILGDHPPAPFVALAPGREVPAHLLGPPEIVARAADWGWRPGLLPDPATPARPMSGLRDDLLAAFGAARADAAMALPDARSH